VPGCDRYVFAFYMPAHFPPLPKQQEIVRRVNALYRVRLRLSVVVASRRCERLKPG
jgi:hypothetical protein